MADVDITTALDPGGIRRGTAAAKRNINDFEKGTTAGLKRVAAAFGAVGLAAVAVRGLRQAVKVSREFEQSLGTVRAVTGANEAQFKALTAEARRLGATTRFSATQAGEGMLALARAGFEVDAALQATETTLKLAQAGALELGQAANIASNILASFGLRVGELERVADVLAATANKSNTTVAGLGDSFSKIGPLAAELEVSLETVSAAFGLLGNVGIPASDAGVAVRNMLLSLIKFTPEATRAIEGLGLSTDDVNLNVVSFADALSTLREAGFGAEESLAIFGKRLAAPALGLVKSADQLREFDGVLRQSGGTADEVATIMDDNLNGRHSADVVGMAAIVAAARLGQRGLPSGGGRHREHTDHARQVRRRDSIHPPGRSELG